MTTRRTIRIEVTDIGEDGPGFDGPLNRESATLVRDWQMTMGHDLMPSQVIERIRGWLDKPPAVGIRLPADDGLTPDQIRRAAEKLTASCAAPRMDMTPGEFIRSDAIYALASALREVADEDGDQ